MSSLHPFREVIDGALTYRWHAGQQKALQSKARIIALLAGSQGGKTVTGPRWLHSEIVRTMVSNTDTQAVGENDYLAGTANYDLFKLKFLPEMLWYFEEKLRIGRYWGGDRIIELAENLIPGKFRAQKASDPMWGRIILRSAEAAGGWESGTFKAAVLDEAGHPDFRREAWEGCQRRLAINRGRILILTTLYTFGWLKTEVYDRARAGDLDIEIIQFDSTLNPSFPREEYERAARTLPAWKFDMFYRGRFTKPAGLIYDKFDEAICKKPRQSIPPEWSVYVGHDFGPIHTSALWYAQDPGTGYLWLYRTYLTREKRTAAQNTAEWQKLSGKENIVKCVGGAVGSADEGWRNAYRLAGWPVAEPMIREVEVGIDRVYAWHAHNRLMVFDDLFDYLDEKLSYSRKLDDNYQPTEEIQNKSLYHLMDGERAILSDLFPVDVINKGGMRSRVSYGV